MVVYLIVSFKTVVSEIEVCILSKCVSRHILLILGSLSHDSRFQTISVFVHAGIVQRSIPLISHWVLCEEETLLMLVRTD